MYQSIQEKHSEILTADCSQSEADKRLASANSALSLYVYTDPKILCAHAFKHSLRVLRFSLPQMVIIGNM